MWFVLAVRAGMAHGTRAAYGLVTTEPWAPSTTGVMCITAPSRVATQLTSHRALSRHVPWKSQSSSD